MPMDKRTKLSPMPMRVRTSAAMPEWVVEAGWLARDSVPPKLTANLKMAKWFKKRNAAA